METHAEEIRRLLRGAEKHAWGDPSVYSDDACAARRQLTDRLFEIVNTEGRDYLEVAVLDELDAIYREDARLHHWCDMVRYAVLGLE